jgi:hypothetical protein
MNLNNLQDFLDQNKIPKIIIKPKTFLEIAKQPHYENVISNIYGFFFNVYEEHGLKDLFIRSLVSCVHERTTDKDFSSFSDFTITTEYGTKGLGKKKKRGRIDLLLRSHNQAIIIENKIYHHLDNDLDDYWNSVIVKSEGNSGKIGIILSLKPISQNHYQQFEFGNEYINITHSQFMQKVMSNAPSYLENNSNRHVHFFHDFYQNIINISSPTMNPSDINFYLKNQEKVNQLVLFKQQFKNHVVAEVNKAGHSINNVKLIVPKNKGNARRLRYYRSIKHPELVYTIVFEELFKDTGFLHIIVEPRGNTLKNGNHFKHLPLDKTQYPIIKSDFYDKTNESYAHFAHKEYRLTTEDISDLSGFIQTKIKEDGFAFIFEKLLSVLETKEIHHT